MGYNFNLNIQSLLASRGFASTRFSIFGQGSSTLFQPSAGQAIPYSSYKSQTPYDMTDLVSSLKEKFSFSYIGLRSKPVVSPKVETKTYEDMSVMQNYGIVCPKLVEDDPIIFDVAQNYGIVCPKDTSLPEEEPYNPPFDKGDIKEACVDQNYGIVLAPEDSSLTYKSPSDYSKIMPTAMMNYGIICPSDVDILNNYPNS